MAKKTKIRLSPKRPKAMNRVNEITVIVICAVFIVVGVFLVYRSFAATIPK